MTTRTSAGDGGTLHALSKRDVQRICSGQAVVDLATAVKELVENALDAGATLVDVKLRESGLAAVEVSDDGAGVAPANFAALARKHHTSKIRSFEDIESVASFGFRGEALSSICQLVASFSVVTRTSADEVGTLLEFDTAGNLVRQTPKARPVGTTVIIEELFKPLAVRHKDFHRNIKKHYAKLLKVLQAYAVSSTNVKICVSNATGKNAARQTVLSTQAHQSMSDNIASVFGSKFVRTLVAVEIDLTEACERIRAKQRTTASRVAGDSQDDSGKSNDDDDDDMSASQLEKTRRVVGYVSKVGAGVGRSDNDRQFFFINGRPFDLPKVAKALNEVWRQYEMKQKPACVLNFLLPLGEYDVNVTPDKRETFIKHEAEVIEAFKLQLNKLYEPSRGTFTVQPLLSTFTRAAKKADGSNDHEDSEAKAALQTALSSPSPLAKAHLNAAAPSPESAKSAGGDSEQSIRVGEHSLIRPQAVIVEVLSPKKRAPPTSSSPPPAAAAPRSPSTGTPPLPPQQLSVDAASTTSSAVASPCCSSSHSDDAALKEAVVPPEIVQQPRPKRPRVYHDTGAAGSSEALKDCMQSTKWSLAEMMKQRKQFFAEEVEGELERRTRQSRLTVPKTCSAGGDDTGDSVDNEVAAAALQRMLKKDDFTRMQVLGQFNLGFVIGKLADDLFIIDQHASDEKFNYETLQQTTVLHQQPLVRPMPLELTAGEEMVVLDHLDVFAKNGFTFLVAKDAPATKKLKLLSLPFTKHTQFGVEDIRELASLLMDAPLNAACIRLPKIMAMFASRACRSSIMIGTALHKEEMQKIVRNLSGLEQPWNCPHGRPTLRHLVDLRQLEDQS